MTTIVANLECMAADQRTTGAGPIFHHNKIHRIKGSLFGLAGETVLCELMVRWLRTPGRDLEALYKLVPVDHRDEVWALELSKTGLSFWNLWGVPVPLLDRTYAIGSGAGPALTSLRRGDDPATAVLAALPQDECSGTHAGQPQVEYLVPPKPSRKGKDSGWRKALGDG